MNSRISLVARRGFRVALTQPYKHLETEFDRKWRGMSRDEKEALTNEYLPIQNGDWKGLTMEQKRNLYTIAFGAPEEADPGKAFRVFMGTLAVCGLAYAMFLVTRLFATPPSPTYNEEHYEKVKEYMRSQNAHPVDKSFD